MKTSYNLSSKMLLLSAIKTFRLGEVNFSEGENALGQNI